MDLREKNPKFPAPAVYTVNGLTGHVVLSLAGSGVTTLNALAGALTIAAGTNINVSDNGVDTVTVAATGLTPTTRTISTNLPLTGGGDLSANRTLDINNFTGDSGLGGLDGAVPAPAAGDAAAGKFLKANGNWAVPSGGTSSPLTTKGDLWGFSTVDARVPVTGSDGYLLTKSSAAATGVAWTAPSVPGGASVQDDFIPGAPTTTFTASATPITGSTIVVTYGGVSLPTSQWSVTGSVLTIGFTVPAGQTVCWVYWTTLPASQTQTQEDFTATSLQTDFVLAHTPVTGSVMVYSGGVFQPGAAYSIISVTTVRFATGRTLNATVSVSYRY